MTPRVSSTTKVNRAALDAIRAGAVDGLERFAERFLESNRPNVPDEPPFGVGLVDTAAWGIWVDGKKVAGFAAKPRAVSTAEGIALLVGYDFPGHFAEGGTIHEHARPFVTPHAMEMLPDVPEFVGAGVENAARGVR